jgi:hypothetical protein
VPTSGLGSREVTNGVRGSGRAAISRRVGAGVRPLCEDGVRGARADAADEGLRAEGGLYA